MKRCLLLVFTAMVSTGCIAVPALEERERLHDQAIWTANQCPSVRGRSGAVVHDRYNRAVPLEHVPGEWFSCSGRRVHRDALRAVGSNKVKIRNVAG